MKPKLPDSIRTPEDLKELLNDLKRYSSWLSNYHIKQRVSGTDAPTQPPTLAMPALELLKELQAAQHLKREALDQLIKDLQKIDATAPRITFTLAAAPSNGLKLELVHWCRTNIDPTILVSFQFNATLLGGMVVRYGSHIFDWSFRRQVLANRSRFPEVLRNV